MSPLELVGSRQAAWSVTANRLKETLDRVRWGTFVLAIGGAVLATAASQLPDGDGRRWVALAGAVVLGVGAFLTSRLATAMQVGGWVKARAAAEALKREAYRFAAGAAPYDGANAADALRQEREKIEEGTDDLVDQLIDTGKPGSTPTAPITPDEYVARRVRGQIDKYYRPKAEEARRMAARLRAGEFVLALIAAVLTAVVGVLKKYPVEGFPFDLAALTAVLTTIGALVLAHIEAMRYDYLVITYRATARRLEDALADVGALPPAPSPQWSAFVDRCENIIATENTSWVAKWTGK